MSDEDFRDTVREAENGEVDSQFVLADAYYTGEGMERDYAKAAEQDDFEALYCLGVCYENGHGVKKDTHKAFELYLQAAQEGVTKAMAAVSRCYRDGIGVEKNGQEADFWAGGETKTKQRNLRALQAGMEEVRNFLVGSKWFTQTLQNSVKAGKPDDMVFLAELHLEGKGVPYKSA